MRRRLRRLAIPWFPGMAMLRLARRFAGSLAATAMASMLAACVSVGPGDPTPLTWYELQARPPAQVAPRTDPRGLWIDVLPGSAFYEALSIAYSRAPAERAYYRFANWTEPVDERLARILARDLRARQAFSEVGVVGDGSRAQLYLRIVVSDFYHDAAVEPGFSRLAFSAELVDIATRRNLGRRDFGQAAALDEANAAAAVAAFDVALAAALDELAAWLVEVAAR